MPLFVDDSGRQYVAPEAMQPSHSKKPFISSQLEELLDGEAPQTPETIAAALDLARHDSHFINNLKMKTIAEKKLKEKENGNT